MNKKTKEKIIIEIGSFKDVASDFKDVWSDLNGILDYEFKGEKKLLDDFLGLIINFEKEIDNSLNVINKLEKK